MKRALVLLAACGGGAGGVPDARVIDGPLGMDPMALPHDGGLAGASGVPWPEADALFHQEPRWLGSDAAYSIDLGGGRVAWLFGDTFIATSNAHHRDQSTMPRNTIAVETGLDPTTATMQFAWGAGDTSYFADDGARWHWPAGGVRFPDGPLVVFLGIFENGPNGFQGAGWRIARITDPDDPPDQWQITMIDPPTQPVDAVPGAGVAIDGDDVVFLAYDGAHAGWLGRIGSAQLGAGDLSAITWSAAPVLAATATEGSLSGDWLQVESRGFGATTIAVRDAPDPAGPWSDLIDAYTPPESTGTNPFVYAGKAHPELTTPDATLAVTYATNSFTYADLFTPDGEANLYWPRFARLTLTARPLR